jgi:hypothetical protein
MLRVAIPTEPCISSEEPGAPGHQALVPRDLAPIICGVLPAVGTLAAHESAS